MAETIPGASDQHAGLAVARSGIRWWHRPWALARVAEMACYVVAVRAFQALRRVQWAGRDDGMCLQALERDGVFVHRLSRSGRQALVDAALPWFTKLEEARERIGRGKRDYCDNQLDTPRRQAPALHGVVERVLADAGMLAAARGYLGCRAEVRKVTMQINDEWDRFWRAPFEERGLPIPPTAVFHIDNTYGVVKAILYLSEVGESNGPFSYVPGTHRLEVGWFGALMLRAVDIWIDVHPEERPLFAALPGSLRRKAKFGDDFPPGDPWGESLVKRERVLTSADGDVFLFDVKGVHRGGMVARGERRAIQVMMS